MMRDHPYGEEIQVDFTGDTYMVQTFNGKIKCWIMVLSFPASYYTYGGIVTSQSTAETCRVIGDAVKYFGNIFPDLLYCDNASAMVTSHKGTSIVFNKNFKYFMTGLGVAVNAAPPRCPQHKSCVEESVKLVEIRVGKNEQFINGLTDVKTISDHSIVLQNYIECEINKKEFKKDALKTREFLFNTYEKPKLKHIHHIPEYIDDIRYMCVPASYHLSINEHWYSVPYQYIKSYVDVFVTNDLITIKYKGAVIAEHCRCDGIDQLRGPTGQHSWNICFRSIRNQLPEVKGSTVKKAFLNALKLWMRVYIFSVRTDCVLHRPMKQNIWPMQNPAAEP